MAIDKWFTVSCECGMTSEVLPTVAEARKAAERDGWRRLPGHYVGRRPGDRFGGRLVPGVDLCPSCTEKSIRR